MEDTAMPLLETFLKCKTLQDYADCSMELIGNPMLIMDMNMHVAACTNVDVDDPTFMYMKQHRYPMPRETGNLEWQRTMRVMLAQQGVTHAHFKGYEMLQKPLNVNGVLVGNIHSTAYFRPFTQQDFTIVELISSRIALELYRIQSVSQAKDNTTEYFLQYLLDGNVLTQEELDLQAGLLGWKLEKNLYVICANMYADGVYYAENPFIGLCGSEDKILRYKSSAVAILNRQIPLTGEILAEFERDLDKLGYVCGMSRRFDTLAGLASAYEQALAALDIGRRIDGVKNLYQYPDYLPYMLIRKYAQTENVLDYVNPEILRFADEDRRQKSEIMKTVRLYMYWGRSIQKVASLLNAHRNTISYRITRFSELTGLDFSDGRQYLDLAWSIKVMEYVDRDRFFE